MKKWLIIILAVILIFVVLPYAYLALSGSGYDSIEIIDSAVVLPSAQRYSFNSDTQTVDVRFVKQDIYAVIEEQTGSNAFDYFNSQISGFGLTLRKMGLSFSDGHICADFKLMFRGFLPIPIHAEASANLSDSTVVFSPDKISVGKLIKVSPTVLRSFIESFDIELPEIHPLFNDVNSLSHDGDSFSVIIPYPVEWLMSGVDSFPSDFTMITDFVDLDELDTIMPAVLSWTEGDASGVISCLDSCDSNPGKFIELKADVIGLGHSYGSLLFFTRDGCDYNYLLFPEITKDFVYERYSNLLEGYQSIYDERTGVLSDAFQYVLDGFADGSIIAGSQSMVYKESGNPPVTFSSIPALDGAEKWTDPENFRVILATNCGDYSLRQVPKGNKITAIILRTHTGRPVVAYRHTSSLFKIKSLSEEDYLYYMSAKSVPICDLGEFTTKR